ncbi:MAG TPA: hypothetical protein VL484_12210 [Vicinamibacterales bacterium]|jgi:hypothetical protein|nr:hypothetical protein [Vicinamibacterales bacterium]
MEIRSGTVTALYLFDVAEQIDLAALRAILGGGASARLASKPSAPAYLQYQTPPLVVEAEHTGVQTPEGFRTRFKFFDYGVISVSLVQRFSGSWSELVSASFHSIENSAFEAAAEAAVRALVGRCSRALKNAHTDYLSEDYLVVAVHELEGLHSADDVVASRGAAIAQMVRGEAAALSTQEQNEVLRNRLSYLADDLVVPTWNAAFVYDTEAGAAGVLELIEFGNSQLLEYRYYDRLLDAELTHIYPALQRTSWWRNLFGGGAVAAANQLHSLFIDVNEITDRTENTLKIAGDIYAARVFALVGARLGLARWKQTIEEKLETLDDIYRFAVEQVTISRGQFLELTVVLILLLELVLFFLGVMR